MTRAEAEVARLANIILFPDRYDFYMPKRTHSSHRGYGYGHGSSGSGGGNSGGASSSSNNGSSSSSSSSSNNSNKRTKVRVDKLLNPVDEEVGYGKGKAKAEPR
jgi:hypothetical protein